MNRTIVFAHCLCVASFATQSALYAAGPVKDFTLPSARDSSLVRLSDHAGKVVLINWWRTSCGYCQREHPKLVALEQKYGAKGLVILGVSDDTADTVANVPAYLKRQKIAWPVGLNDQGEFMREIAPNGSGETPANYLVSRSGELSFLGLDRGADSMKKLEDTVVRLLAEPKPNKAAIEPRKLEAAPALSLSDLAGNNVNLRDFSRKPLVVNFFNAGTSDWAGAVIARLHADFGNRGLQVVGVNLFDEDAAIRACINKYRITYPVLRGDEATQRAWIGGSDAWATFFVNSDGKIVKKIANSINNGLEEPVFRKYAEQLLSKSNSRPTP